MNATRCCWPIPRLGPRQYPVAFGKEPGIEVVAEATDGRQALEPTRKKTPNVVVMDIAMLGLNGLQALARATREFSAAKVIILSMHANEEYVLQALRAGASGYLLKDSAVAELELALRAVARGETYLSPRISKRVINNYLERLDTQCARADHLTARQREISN